MKSPLSDIVLKKQEPLKMKFIFNRIYLHVKKWKGIACTGYPKTNCLTLFMSYIFFYGDATAKP